jgi:methylmalonyl-CoA mutase cobalamin-binding subunit
VRHEHLATECLTTQLRQMLANQAESAARPLVLLATLPDEPHTLPLQLVAVYLLAQGARPRLLGGSTPVADIAQSARALGADAVGLTITMLADRKRTRDELRALRKQLEPDFPVWLGGAGAQRVGHDLPGMHLLLSWQAIDAEVEHLRADAAR